MKIRYTEARSLNRTNMETLYPCYVDAWSIQTKLLIYYHFLLDFKWPRRDHCLLVFVPRPPTFARYRCSPWTFLVPRRPTTLTGLDECLPTLVVHWLLRSLSTLNVKSLLLRLKCHPSPHNPVCNETFNLGDCLMVLTFLEAGLSIL